MKYQRLYRAALPLLLAICFVPSSVSAQANSSGEIGKGRKAYSVPISDREITFRVTLPGMSGTTEPYHATIRVQEGGMAKVNAFSSGFAYALVPVARGIDNNSADFTIFQLFQDKDGNESLKETEHVSSTVDQVSESVKTQQKLQIKLLSITEPQKSSALIKVAAPPQNRIRFSF